MLNKEIAELEKINKELDSDLEFQVGDEKENTINSILNNNQMITENKIKIEQIQAEIEEQNKQKENYKNN